ncbi:non-specific serine/threonine protein kinase [Ranunculus cassubicifolius]
MANLFSLLNELRERIVASSTPSPSTSEDDPLETKFRTILHGLLKSHVLPSSSANEREVIAVLKLLTHTARNFPAVFFHGKANAVLPVIGRILPFFAEPIFLSWHGVIFETVGSLLSLLRTGDREAFRQFFLDTMVLVEDLLYVGPICRDTSSSPPKVTVKCFLESFNGVIDNPPLFSDLLDCCRPADGKGILINLTSEARWQPFATWTVKILSKCLSEGTLYVEGLINSSFVSAACALLCFGDASLHMACFDFARITAAVVDTEIVPSENLIRTILCTLDQTDKEPLSVRNAVYDSSMGSCLHALHSSCSDDVVRFVAGDLVSVFPQALQSTESLELKGAMCSAYIRVAKTCPPCIWRPERLTSMLLTDSPCFPLIDCIRVTIDMLGPDRVGERSNDCNNEGVSSTSTTETESLKVGGKRYSVILDSSKTKRQKTGKEVLLSTADAWKNPNFSTLYTFEKDKEYADYVSGSLLAFVSLLKPDNAEANPLKPKAALMALSMLCIAFSNYAPTDLSLSIFEQINGWMAWVCKKAEESAPITFDVCIFLKAVHSMVFLQSSLPPESRFFNIKDNDASYLRTVLKLPWTHSIAISDQSLCMTKCLSIQALSKIGVGFEDEVILEVLDLALHDEIEEVRVEAVISMPVIVMCSGLGLLVHMLERLEFLRRKKRGQVDKFIPLSVGYLACLYGTYDATDSGNACKLFLRGSCERQSQTLDLLSQGFWCPKCDKRVAINPEQSLNITHLLDMQGREDGLICRLIKIHLMLLYDESSEEVQVACVGTIHRVLMHGTQEVLYNTRKQWKECIKFLLLHKKRIIREAFCIQIRYFLEDAILNSLFGDIEPSNKTKEQSFLDILKHAFAEEQDAQIFETLLESTAEIMNAVDIHDQIFFYSLILLVDQLDNPHLIVRMTASRLIHRSCHFHLKGGVDLLLSTVVHIRNELFDYLCDRIVSRPAMIREFAEAVLGIGMEELAKRMVPVVLPKLVVSKANMDKAVLILQELANHLNTAAVPLTVNWVPKVLAYALLRDDQQELFSALQFYQVQTGSDKQEIFGAALPALLDELICFVGDDDLDQTNERLKRVPQMIEAVARVLTQSNDLPGFLRNHFMRILNSIDRKMLRAENLLLQKQALKRIQMLIEMMGSYLATYVPKIMVLLMHSVEKENLQSEGLSVLHFFIKQLVKVSPSSTKHVISQVFAALIPLLEKYKENSSSQLNKVVEILEELVVENMSLLKLHFRELPLLPTIPILHKVNDVIQEARGSMNLREQLRDFVNGLNHESLNVRYMVASELSKLLNLRREDVTTLIAVEGHADLDVLSSLITSLLSGCSEESRSTVGQRLKLVCADCLGALGAVDPAKVKGVPCQRFKIECSDDDLIFELIHKHLARAFRAALDTSIQDSAALAIQELLKVAGCQASLDETVAASSSQSCKELKVFTSPPGTERMDNNGEMNKRGQRLWDRFSNYVKEIIGPCLTSRFQLPNVSDSTSPGPIYRPSMSFGRWISFWIRKLTVHSTGCRASIFNACRGIVRHDMQTATYLLPYLVLNAVCYSTVEARHGISEEILCVLNAAASENNAAASENNAATVPGIVAGHSEVCIQAVFTLLDNLGQWVDDVKQEIALSQAIQPSGPKQQPSKAKGPNVGLATGPDQLLLQCNNVSELLSAIPKVTLAQASFRCQAFARSLLYFESHVMAKSGSFNPASERSGVFEDADVSFLMEIYSGLDEPDGPSGLAHLRKSSSLQDQLLINKKAGNWAEVLTSCEKALQMEPTSVQRHSDVLNCLLNMCHLQAMVTHVDGLISRVPQYKKTWCMQGVQAAWRLGRWDLMNEYLCGADEEGPVCSSSESNASFDIDVAKILQAMMKKDQFSVSEKIAHSRQALLAPLAAAGMDSYMRAYPLVVKLHMLRELEDFQNLLLNNSFLETSFDLDDSKFLKVVVDWDNRLRITQSSLWSREPLLAFRRLVFGASCLGVHVGNCWLQYAKLCRSAGHYETANRAILEAQSSGAPNIHVEKAKLLWSTRRSDGAIAELQQSLLNVPVDVVGSSVIASLSSLSLVPMNVQPTCATQASNENRDVARTLLLYSRWIHCTGQKQKEDVLNLYSRVRELQPKWEKAYFYMAKYCDDLLVDARKRQEENIEPRSRNSATTSNIEEKAWWCYLTEALLYYAKGLHRGHKNLFQALPRLLTLWFEFGSKYHRANQTSKKDLKVCQQRVMSIMRGCLKDLPKYQWLTALPQLVSRICHQNDETVRLVKLIITEVLQEYPQQVLWIMAAVSKSTVSARRDAASEIIQAARKGFSHGNDGNNLYLQFASLVDHLIKLCFHPGQQPKARTINISTEFSALKRMMPLGIIMPIQQALTVTLPSYEKNLTGPLRSDIFSATELVTISGIKDEAEILTSLQRPKKVVFIGSDGAEYPFLCKPKDDLRKDARMMEFVAMINRLLSKYPESRRRKLYIRTFAVIPLTEDCGMIEWVPHTRGLRHILQDIYVTHGKFDRSKTNPLIKRIYDQCQGKIAEDELLKSKILPMFPPVFHKWFLSMFSEPAAWFRARIAYAHTTAVWSMVGHIVGLGDRHGENILFDSTTGDCVHVDFSCLFDKGLQLEKPELVPFRLTQNMIDGLGITGYEGIFLKVCEITLSVLRTHRETLMSVLETFIHDPLVEWTKSHKSSGVEVQNPHAQRAIGNIEARLQGVVVGVGAAPSLPLAVEGQARRLIAEAVSHRNLGKMYIWWMPWF